MMTFNLKKQLPSNKARALELLFSPEAIAKRAKSVRQVKVILQDKFQSVSEWFCEIEGLPIHWKQKSLFDPKNSRVTFEAIEGDFSVFKGAWSLSKLDTNLTEIHLQVSVELGIQGFDHIIGDILKDRLEKNFESVLHAMEEILIQRNYEKQAGRMPKKISGFVVMGHPYNFNHLVRIFEVFHPGIRNVTPDFLLKMFELAPSYLSSKITNFKSKAQNEIDGYFVMCPIIPDMARLTPEIVFKKVLDGCRVGERLGAGVLALGGFTSIVGEKYLEELKSRTKIPITTGNTFTAALTLQGVREAAKIMNINLKRAHVTVIGGTGDIGSACSRVLANEVQELTITGRTPATMKEIQKTLKKTGTAKVTISTDNDKAVATADIIIAAASSTQSLIDLDSIKQGAVVCDVGYPKNISYGSKNKRNDILVFSGGLTQIPTAFDLGFDIGMPSKNILYGCFAEAILLSLEGKYENFSEGKGNITPEKINWIWDAAKKHGFDLAPFYWGDMLVRKEEILQIQQGDKSYL